MSFKEFLESQSKRVKIRIKGDRLRIIEENYLREDKIRSPTEYIDYLLLSDDKGGLIVLDHGSAEELKERLIELEDEAYRLRKLKTIYEIIAAIELFVIILLLVV